MKLVHKMSEKFKQGLSKFNNRKLIALKSFKFHIIRNGSSDSTLILYQNHNLMWMKVCWHKSHIEHYFNPFIINLMIVFKLNKLLFQFKNNFTRQQRLGPLNF